MIVSSLSQLTKLTSVHATRTTTTHRMQLNVNASRGALLGRGVSSRIKTPSRIFVVRASQNDSASPQSAADSTAAAVNSAVSSAQEIASTATQKGSEAVDAAAHAINNAVDEEIAAIQQTAETEALEAAAAVTTSRSTATVAEPETKGANDPTMVEMARFFIHSNPIITFLFYGTAGFLGITFVIALVRVGLKNISPQAKRKKTVNKNKAVIDSLSQYLPANRSGLTGAVMAGLRLKTGFKPVEIFRKYLWYLLRERKFDQEAVDDVLALRGALGLSDEQVAEALKERAQRIYEKYGNIMLDTSGMTQAGIERKATARALFSKLLYLAENEQLLSPEAAKSADLREIYGATEDDIARLRIASLYDVDLEAAMAQPSAPEPESGDE